MKEDINSKLLLHPEAALNELAQLIKERQRFVKEESAAWFGYILSDLELTEFEKKRRKLSLNAFNYLLYSYASGDFNWQGIPAQTAVRNYASYLIGGNQDETEAYRLSLSADKECLEQSILSQMNHLQEDSGEFISMAYRHMSPPDYRSLLVYLGEEPSPGSPLGYIKKRLFERIPVVQNNPVPEKVFENADKGKILTEADKKALSKAVLKIGFAQLKRLTGDELEKIPFFAKQVFLANPSAVDINFSGELKRAVSTYKNFMEEDRNGLIQIFHISDNGRIPDSYLITKINVSPRQHVTFFPVTS